MYPSLCHETQKNNICPLMSNKVMMYVYDCFAKCLNCPKSAVTPYMRPVGLIKAFSFCLTENYVTLYSIKRVQSRSIWFCCCYSLFLLEIKGFLRAPYSSGLCVRLVANCEVNNTACKYATGNHFTRTIVTIRRSRLICAILTKSFFVCTWD